MKQAFSAKTAVVTGAGRGIGRAVALGLAAEGAQVALLARTRDEIAEVADQVLGPIDIVINNAAVVWPLGPTVEVDSAEWAAAIATNVVAAATLSMALLPSMLDRGWGRIVNVSTGAVAQPAGMIRGNAYVRGKAALEAHTLNLAAELDGSGVTVNVYRPGGVDTAMQAWIRKQEPEWVGAALHERFVRSHAEGSLLTPEQTAASLLARLPGSETGCIWDASDAL